MKDRSEMKRISNIHSRNFHYLRIPLTQIVIILYKKDITTDDTVKMLSTPLPLGWSLLVL